MGKVNVAFQYLKHLLRANNRHGIHSPFVYTFLEEVLYQPFSSTDFEIIKRIRKAAKRSEKQIRITDLGAGSTVNPARVRKIKDIARNSSKPEKYGKLFYKMVQYYQPKSVIELGTSLGFSTLYFALANPDITVHTIEGCSNTKAQAMGTFMHAQARNIKSLLGNFDQVYPHVLAEVGRADMVFIDGNHSFKGTWSYFEATLPYVHANTILIFDDIHWSDGMRQAWEKIKSHPQVRVTLDLYFVGIVFFNPHLSKQDFLIRY